MRKIIISIIILLLVLSAASLGASIALLLNPSTATRITTVPSLNTNSEIISACNYLVSNYNATNRLIYSTLTHDRQYLYSDNYLASIALNLPCKRMDLSNSMGASLSQYPKYPNQYQVLTAPYTHFFNGSTDVRLSGTVWTTINNVTGPVLSPNEYADIAFLQAYNFSKWSHDNTSAQYYFGIGASMFNGTGIIDRPFRVTPQFQTYKLALYIYLAAILNDTLPASVVVNLGRMQAPTGGFYTGYLSDYSTDGTSTNTESTSLAIMALASLSIPSYIHSSSTSQVSMFAVPLLYLGIGTGITAIIVSSVIVVSRRRKRTIVQPRVGV